MSDEHAFWNTLKPILHAPTHGRVAWKVQDAFKRGLPDVLGHVEGTAYLLELKYRESMPARSETLVQRLEPSIEQLRHLAEWHHAGGIAGLLMGSGRDWWLIFDPTIMRTLPLTQDQLYRLRLHPGCYQGDRQGLQFLPQLILDEAARRRALLAHRALRATPQP